MLKRAEAAKMRAFKIGTHWFVAPQHLKLMGKSNPDLVHAMILRDHVWMPDPARYQANVLHLFVRI